MFGDDGTIGPTFNKVLRVPFGEYVPLRGIVERVTNLSLIPRDAVPGDGPEILETSVGRLGVMVSFENFFPDRARAAIAGGATVLLVPTTPPAT